MRNLRTLSPLISLLVFFLCAGAASVFQVYQGGTGIASYTKGDIPIASAATTLSKLAIGSDFKTVKADSSQTTGVSWANSFLPLFVATASAGPNNTNAATSLFGSGVGSTTLATDQLIAGRTLVVDLSGTVTTQAVATGNVTVLISVGGVTACTTGAIAIVPASFSNALFTVHADITCRTNGGGGTLFSQGWFEVETPATGVPLRIPMSKTATTAVDTTSTNTVDCTWTFGTANAANIATCTNSSIVQRW